MTTTIHNIQHEDTVADAVMQAARAAVEQNNRFLLDPGLDISPRNRDLMLLLDCLLDCAVTTAAAIAENAWDEPAPVPHHRVNDAIAMAHRAAAEIAGCSQIPARALL